MKIKRSLGRYLSLFIIVMVGVGFFTGIQSTAPDMISVADQYYKSHNLMDFKIISTLGLTDADVQAVKQLSHVKEVLPSYSLDVLDQDKAIRVHAIEKSMNTVQLSSGRMPKTDHECVADSKTYKIGDHVKITSDEHEKLKNTEFTVVGTAQSVLYLSDEYGSTTIGDGKLASFIFINRTNFILDAYTEIYLTATGSNRTVAYTKDYDQPSSQLNNELIKIKPSRENARHLEIQNKADLEINQNEMKLHDERAKGEKKLADAKAELDANAQKLKNGKNELVKNESDLQKNIEKQKAEFATAQAKITDGWNQINQTLAQNGIKKDELNAKMNDLHTAIASMQSQLSHLSAGSNEYTQLDATIRKYSASYDGLTKLKGSIDTLTAQETELNKGIQTYNAEIKNAKDKINTGKSDLAANEQKLNDGYAEYNANMNKFRTEITDAQTKINDAKNDLSDIEKPQWHIFDRDAAIGYDELKSGIDVVSSVAAVLPFFFILIVLLMTSNSMARMIAEERSELGTLTSLGYKDNHIISTYLLYVLSASGLGTAAGFFIGCRIIPPLIYSNFRFILPPLIIQYDMVIFLLILAVTIALMTLVTIVSCNTELKQKPSALMRPVPPKNGQKILLEKINPIWIHLSFTWKVTLRNLFRYKKRALMTIVGVAGCTSFLLAGFGLRDSMNGVAQKQYGEIFRYSNMMILKNETQAINQDVSNLFAKEQIREPLLIKQTAFRCESTQKSLDAFLIVPENEDIFYQYYHLKSKATGSGLTLNDSGVVITQKLSDVFKAKQGNTITVKDVNNNTYSFKVTGVAENYTSNYIYMNKTLYHNVFGKSAAYNTIVSNHNGDQKAIAKHLIASGFVLNVIFTNDVLQKALNGNNSLNSIIILVVVVASLLAIIVLYNLTSINISERTREIATLKVLGFHDGETNGYIYREALILTIISIVVGLILGIFLHGFVVDVIESFASLFFRRIRWTSFVLSALLTVAFSFIMQIVTFFKLRTIDMIESLKSVE